METLVRRLGRIFSEKKYFLHRRVPVSHRKENLLEQTLSAWITRKGWRAPYRTLSEAADALDTDTVTLHHYFDRRVGLDFRTWRTRLRVEDAKGLLLDEPETAISTIARRVGFSDRSNFSRQFLFHTGMTPAEWRKKAGRSHDIPAPENDYV